VKTIVLSMDRYIRNKMKPVNYDVRVAVSYRNASCD
jgi:hypothetical protein